MKRPPPHDDAASAGRGGRGFNKGKERWGGKKRNEQRLGGSGGALSLAAFANAKSRNTGYNPALIKKQKEYYRNAKLISKYKRSRKQQDQSNCHPHLTISGEGGHDAKDAPKPHDKTKKHTSQSLKVEYEKKRLEDEKAKNGRDVIIQAKKEEREKSEAKRKELREKMFKRTRSGQPVMKYRIEHLLETAIESSNNLYIFGSWHCIETAIESSNKALNCTMEDLPEALFAEVIRRITRTNDLNSLSLVSKQLYKAEADQRGAIRVGCGLCPATEALVSLCTRFPNLHKVEIDYSGWTAGHGNQLDNQGLFVFSSNCPMLASLTLSFCSYIDDSGLGYLAYFKKLASLRLNSTPNITSRGLVAVAVGCKSLSALHLIDCQNIGSKDWLEYLGCDGSLEELMVKNCEGISQDDFLKFGPGWMKLQKFVFESNKRFFVNVYLDYDGYDPSYNAHSPNMYDICCESLKDLSLVCIEIPTGKGLRFLLGRCKALEKLCLEYVRGLNHNDMIALSQTCKNLKSISLWLDPQFYTHSYRTAFTDNSLKALALSCPMLQTVELTFAGCVPEYPSEIGFTQKGLVVLIQSCPIRFLVLNGANFFDDEGMEAVSSAPNLESLELVDCEEVTDAGMRFIARAPCLINLTLRLCEGVTDGGVAELVHAQKLESLIIEGCSGVSLQAVNGVARSVQYNVECASRGHLKRRLL